MGNSSNRYLGIWYKNLPLTVVWVANRNNPIDGFSGNLALSSNGVSLSNNSRSSNNCFWKVINLFFFYREKSDSNAYKWQSFDDITDTLLLEMKLGCNLQTGLHRNMMSWSTAHDPSNGKFTFKVRKSNIQGYQH
ncbi:hypothetical protein UlMin_010176 [Ulmus minor]